MKFEREQVEDILASLWSKAEQYIFELSESKYKDMEKGINALFDEKIQEALARERNNK